MKKLQLIILLCIFYSSAFAQFDDIIKTITPDIELLEEKNITTSINDALPVAYWLKDINSVSTPIQPENTNFDLEPGYYTFRIQSYCLKAGTHGPTKGSGYLMAPLKGKRSDLVYNLVKRSVEHPDVAQSDIQVLLWGIVYGAKFTDYSPDFQNKVRVLLTPTEIADLSFDIKNVPLDIMPDEIKDVAKFYQDFRNKLVNPASNYQEIERMAMLDGVIPDDALSKHVQKGLWSHIGNGFYVRAFPEAYYTTNIEIYRPGYVTETKDSKGRISMLERDGHIIEITYDDENGKDVLAVSGKGDYPIWRISSIKLKGTESGEETIIENTGWIVKGNGESLKGKGGNNFSFNINGDPTFEEYNSRNTNAKNSLKNFESYMKDKKTKVAKDMKNEYWADFHTMEGLKVATNPLNKTGQLSWINKTLNLVTDWWHSSISSLAGEGSTDNSRRHADITKMPAVPATNGMQRLLPSERRQSN